MREKIRHHITHNHLCDNDNAIWYDQMNQIFEYFDSYCHLKNIIQYLYDRYIMYKWMQISLFNPTKFTQNTYDKRSIAM